MNEKEFYQALTSQGLTIPPAAPERLRAYHALLADWQARINLVSPQAWHTIYEELYLDSLEPVLAGLVAGPARGVDVGSGAGIPGILLAIFVPGLEVTLVESRRSKALFLQKARETLHLGTLTVAHQPAEVFIANSGRARTFDYVFFKAFADATTCLKISQRLMKPSGRTILYKGPEVTAELAAAQQAFPDLACQTTGYSLPQTQKKRNLIVVSQKAVN
jgi:16S rRNA (guanine527-N7)-methyltransferase